MFSPKGDISCYICTIFDKRPFTDLWEYQSVACKKSMRPNIEYIMLNDRVKVD